MSDSEKSEDSKKEEAPPENKIPQMNDLLTKEPEYKSEENKGNGSKVDDPNLNKKFFGKYKPTALLSTNGNIKIYHGTNTEDSSEEVTIRVVNKNNINNIHSKIRLIQK